MRRRLLRRIVALRSSGGSALVAPAGTAPTITPGQSFSASESASTSTVLGTLAASGSPSSWTITSGNVGSAVALSNAGVLTVAAGFDFETRPNYTIYATATNAYGTSAEDSFSLVITDVADVVPVVLSGQSFSVSEAASIGATVGVVALAITGDSEITGFAIASGNTGGAFAVSSGGVLTTATALDYDVTPSYTIGITSSNSAGVSSTVNLTITVTAAGTAPTITSGQGATGYANVPEGTTAVFAVPTATGDAPIVWSLSGADAAEFTINSSTAALAFASTPVYASGGDNERVIVITATNGAGSASQTATITITEVASGEPLAATATPSPSATLRYVATTGSDSNNGLTPGTAWATIQKAATTMTAGMTCYIKAGSYSGAVVPANSGTLGNEIQYIGYTTTPGDAPSVKSGGYPITQSAATLPLLNGGNRAANTGILFSGKSHLVFRNIQVTQFRIGIYGDNANACYFDNCSALSLGNTAADYDGFGIKVMPGSTACVVRNCVVGNANAEAFVIFGSYNEAVGCIAYCNDNSTGVKSATDYYFFCGDSYNRIRNCVAERIGALGHGGHGFLCKTVSHHHFFSDNEAIGFDGEAYACKHPGAHDNTYKRNVARNGGGIGFAFSEGAHDNYVEAHTVTSMGFGVMFYNVGEALYYTTGDDYTRALNNASTNNTVNGITLTNIAAHLIRISNYTNSGVTSDGNVIDGMTATNAPYLYQVGHTATNCQLKNSTLTNITNKAEYVSGKTSANLGFSYSGNSLVSCGFTLP